MSKIDKKDRRILHALCENARQPFSRIAKRVGLSKNAVAYRVERLRKQGIVKNFIPILNLYPLELHTYNLFLKVKAPSKEDMIFRYLNDFGYAIWVARLSGPWDLAVEVVARGHTHFCAIIDKLCNEMGEHIIEYKTLMAFEVFKVVAVAPTFFEGLGLPEPKFHRAQGKGSFDAFDLRLLHELSKDALQSRMQLSRTLQASHDTIAHRMKNLEQSGAIITYKPHLDLTELGYTNYFLNLKLRNPSEKSLESLRSSIITNPHIRYAVRSATSFEIMVLVEVQDSRMIDTISKEFRNRYFDIIQDQELMLVTEPSKLMMMPEGLIKSS